MKGTGQGEGARRRCGLKMLCGVNGVLGQGDRRDVQEEHEARKREELLS